MIVYSNNYEEDERLFSTGDSELDDILEEVYYSGIEDGYDYAQREFSKEEKRERDKDWEDSHNTAERVGKKITKAGIGAAGVGLGTSLVGAGVTTAAGVSAVKDSRRLNAEAARIKSLKAAGHKVSLSPSYIDHFNQDLHRIGKKGAAAGAGMGVSYLGGKIAKIGLIGAAAGLGTRAVGSIVRNSKESNLDADMYMLKSGKMPKEEFMKKYGYRKDLLKKLNLVKEDD